MFIPAGKIVPTCSEFEKKSGFVRTEEAETGSEKVARAWTRLETVTLVKQRRELCDITQDSDNVQLEDRMGSSTKLWNSYNLDKKNSRRYDRSRGIKSRVVLVSRPTSMLPIYTTYSFEETFQVKFTSCIDEQRPT
ncbi:uncharacterized protein LOC118444983 [Vespa mandarinia]|uniref:uncharacterized protein LOC118444983 n=1 Tax=Vespa mandarinia TaxID=7446 RepID=UPI0016119F32|nr:uncharacterized protein LOC118444983 [Vespa mandarinia]